MILKLYHQKIRRFETAFGHIDRKQFGSSTRLDGGGTPSARLRDFVALVVKRAGKPGGDSVPSSGDGRGDRGDCDGFTF